MQNQTLPPVLGKQGLRGRLLTNFGLDNMPQQVVIELEDGRRVQAPGSLLVRQADGSYYIPVGTAELEQAMPAGTERLQRESGGAYKEALVVPVYREELSVGKRTVETGRARITKQVVEHEEVIDEPLLRQDVQIERVPINRQWEGPPPPPRYEADKLVIPLLEEVLVVEKRLMLKEELHISRVGKTVREPQTVTLRSENVSVERVEQESDRRA